MKKFQFYIITIILLFVSLIYVFFRPYDTLKHCLFLDMDSDVLCSTNHIYYYGMNIYFNNYLDFPVTDDGSYINLIRIPTADIQYIDKLVRLKAKLSAYTLMDRNKIKLALNIINNIYPHLDVNEDISEEEYLKILQNLTDIPLIQNYIGAANKVVELSDDDIKILPAQKDKKIRYAVYYNNGIVNYYDDLGEMVLRINFFNGKIYRYQTFDSNGDFCTFDSDNKLVEYSKDNIIFDANNKVVYIVSHSKPFYPQITYLPKHSKQQYNGTRNPRHILMQKLNNKDSFIHKSLVKVVDKHYAAGSYNLVVKDLAEYLKDLKYNRPYEYKYFERIFSNRPLTLNFIKVGDNYVFSVNSSGDPDLDTLSSMANTVNVYSGRCAEPLLKSQISNIIVDNYLYDIQIEKDDDGNLVVTEYPPCITCSKNISLWGWKYPKTTISQ